MNAAEVAAKTDVVFMVYPGDRIAARDGLVGVKIRLLLVQAGELIECEAGQSIVERIGGTVEDVESDLPGYVGRIGEIVAQLDVAAVPAGGEVVGDLAFADGIAKLKRILVHLLLAAKVGEDVQLIGSVVAVVEVGVHRLTERVSALPHILANHAHDG